MAGGLQGRHANAPALELHQVLEVGQRACIDREHQLRRAPQRGEGAAVDTVLAQQDHALEPACGQIGLALQQRLLRQAVAGVVLQVHLQPFGAEVLELLGNGQRQVVQRGLAAEGQGEPGFFRPLLGVGKALAQQRRRRSAPQPLAARQIRNQWGDEYRGGHGFGNYLTVAQGTHAGIGSSPNRVSA